MIAKISSEKIFTKQELKTIYKLARESEQNAPESEEEIYNDYYDEYEEPISKKILVSLQQKVSKLLPKEDTEEIDKDFLRRKYHTFNNDIDEKVYSILKTAFEQLKTVEIEYFNMESAEFRKRKLNIYYISSRYTIGYCHLRKEIRTFRTSRISSAIITNNSYKIPKGFNKNDY